MDAVDGSIAQVLEQHPSLDVVGNAVKEVLGLLFDFLFVGTKTVENLVGYYRQIALNYGRNSLSHLAKYG